MPLSEKRSGIEGDELLRAASFPDESWAALVLAPVPPELSADAAAIYAREVHAQARAFLERALEIHTQNTSLAELCQVETPWSKASAERVAVLTELISRETAGELVTPGAEPSSALGSPIDARREFVPARVDL